MNISKEKLLPLITFKTSRSGGKGGQNVNKVNTKAELNFDFKSAYWLNDDEKGRIADRLVNRLTSDGKIQVISEEERSQLLNKERAFEKLIQILQNALFVQKQRKATRPKRSAIENRLKEKQKQALKKISRRKGFDE
jgi:ribosome-associated protein